MHAKIVFLEAQNDWLMLAIFMDELFVYFQILPLRLAAFSIFSVFQFIQVIICYKTFVIFALLPIHKQFLVNLSILKELIVDIASANWNQLNVNKLIV